MIPKSGYRFPACAKPLARSVVWLDASAGEGRSEKDHAPPISYRGFCPSWQGQEFTMRIFAEAVAALVLAVSLSGTAQAQAQTQPQPQPQPQPEVLECRSGHKARQVAELTFGR